MIEDTLRLRRPNHRYILAEAACLEHYFVVCPVDRDRLLRLLLKLLLHNVIWLHFLLLVLSLLTVRKRVVPHQEWNLLLLRVLHLSCYWSVWTACWRHYEDFIPFCSRVIRIDNLVHGEWLRWRQGWRIHCHSCHRHLLFLLLLAALVPLRSCHESHTVVQLLQKLWNDGPVLLLGALHILYRVLLTWNYRWVELLVVLVPRAKADLRMMKRRKL